MTSYYFTAAGYFHSDANEAIRAKCSTSGGWLHCHFVPKINNIIMAVGRFVSTVKQSKC